jgi:hypothetical protein
MGASVARTGTWKMEIVPAATATAASCCRGAGSSDTPSAGSAAIARLIRDFERHYRIAAAFVRLAMIRIMLRRLAAKPPSLNQNSPMGSEGRPEC